MDTPAAVNELIDNLKDIVNKDTFNLTQHDQAAIIVKIEELKKFMQETYGQHKCI